MNNGSHVSFCSHACNFSFLKNIYMLKTDRAVESFQSIYLYMCVMRMIELSVT